MSGRVTFGGSGIKTKESLDLSGQEDVGVVYLPKQPSRRVVSNAPSEVVI